MSEWSWMMEPAARMVRGLRGSRVEQADRGQQLGALRRELKRLQVHLDRRAVVLLQRVHLAQLDVGGVVPVQRVGRLERRDGRVVLLQVQAAQPLVVHYLPIARTDPLRLVVHVDGRFVASQQVERATHLLEVARIARIQARRRLKQLQRLLDLAALPLDQRLDVERRRATPPRPPDTRHTPAARTACAAASCASRGSRPAEEALRRTRCRPWLPLALFLAHKKSPSPPATGGKTP
eukprot:scaffold392_cov101-Isochrysis_galbana.AAC.1